MGRKIVLANGEIYHVYNRSVGDIDIFSTRGNIKKILQLLFYYRFYQKLRFSHFKALSQEVKKLYLNQFLSQIPLVEIYSYALMPNHYHFLIKQIQENGITRFLSNFQNSFAKFFNLKTNRKGALFLTSFKAVRIMSEEQFIHVSRYIHLNPVTGYLLKIEELLTSVLTSFRWYIGKKGKDSFVNTEKILSIFRSKENYKKFIFDQVDYQRKIDKIKKLTLDKNNKYPIMR